MRHKSRFSWVFKVQALRLALRLEQALIMQSTLPGLNPRFGWKPRAGHCSLLVLFRTCRPLFISPDTSGTNGLRDSLLQLTVWLIPVPVSGRIRDIAAVIGVVLWALAGGIEAVIRNLRAGVL